MPTKTVIENHKLYEGHPALPEGQKFIEILYYPTSHAYKESGETLMGVSGVVGIIEKEGLRRYYMNEAIVSLTRNLVPDNDEVFKLPESMKDWEDACKKSKNAHKTRSDRGKENGTFTHSWLEEFLIAKRDGTPAPDLPKQYEVPKKVPGMTWEQVDEIEVKLEFNNIVEALSQFIHYCEQHTIEVVALEQLIFSYRYRYAGRFDAILRIDGKLYLVDFKTNNPTADFPDGVFPEAFIQIGGYDTAYTEEFYPELDKQNQSVFDGHAVFNFSKKTGKFNKRFDLDEDVRLNRSGFIHSLGLKRVVQHKNRKMSMKYKENRQKKGINV